MFEDFPDKFGTIIVDPPWNYQSPSESFRNGTADGTKRPAGYSEPIYKALTTDSLCQLPIGELATDESVLLLWTTMPFVVSGDAQRVVEAWGFKPVTAMTWLKTSAKDETKLSYGVGYWFRGASEMVFVGKRKKAYRSPYVNVGETVTDHLVSPRLNHSQKPEGLHEIAEKTYPGPYLEIFARQYIYQP